MKVYGKYIVADPKIMAGKPVIKGTRIPVDLILKKLSQDIEVDELLEDYPKLDKKHIKEVLGYAHSLVAQEEVYPLRS